MSSGAPSPSPAAGRYVIPARRPGASTAPTSARATSSPSSDRSTEPRTVIPPSVPSDRPPWVDVVKTPARLPSSTTTPSRHSSGTAKRLMCAPTPIPYGGFSKAPLDLYGGCDPELSSPDSFSSRTPKFSPTSSSDSSSGSNTPTCSATSTCGSRRSGSSGRSDTIKKTRMRQTNADVLMFQISRDASLFD